jgi:DNA-binding transcriptional regulator YhcF (GntR family)
VKLDDPVNTLPTQKKNAKLKELYQRMLTEARSHGLDEQQMLAFIKQRKTT